MKKNSASSPLTRLVADDNGYADHKLAWLDEGGNIMTLKVPSLIEPGVTFGSAQGGREGAYAVEGQEFTCSSKVRKPLNLRTADYPFSVQNRVLFTHALARAGLLDTPVEVAVTLPFRDYFSEKGTINTELKEKSASNFIKNDVSLFDSAAKPLVKDVSVYAEALSAFFDWAMDDKGQLTQNYDELCDVEGEILIVDIGGSTTDLASIQISNEVSQGQMLINQAKSGTETIGVLDAKRKLEALMRQEMISEGMNMLEGHTGQLEENVIGRAFETGSVMYAQKRWDFSHARAQACQEVASRITRFINTKVGNPNAYFAILVVGGGAVVFRESLKQMFNNATFLDEFANAKGALKFLMEKRKR